MVLDGKPCLIFFHPCSDQDGCIVFGIADRIIDQVLEDLIDHSGIGFYDGCMQI